MENIYTPCQQSLEKLIWEQYRKAGGAIKANGELDSVFRKLTKKADYLLSTNRHIWVKKRLTGLNDFANWHSYGMEIHFTYALEKIGQQVENSARRITNDHSDIDLVFRHKNGIEVRSEFVFIQTPNRYWTEEESSHGLTVYSAFHSGEEEFFPSRMAQSKIRLKTIRKTGEPTKFPAPGKEDFHLIICDVTQGFGCHPDYWDLQLLTQGRRAVDVMAQRNLLGLFEPKNTYGEKFDAEFGENRYLRERIHCILFLMDNSHWQSSLDPDYTCCVMLNNLLCRSDEQNEAFNSFTKLLSALMPRYLTGQKWTQ